MNTPAYQDVLDRAKRYIAEHPEAFTEKSRFLARQRDAEILVNTLLKGTWMSEHVATEALAAVKQAMAEVEKLLAQFGRGAGGRETALAATKLEEAEMWLLRLDQIDLTGQPG